MLFLIFGGYYDDWKCKRIVRECKIDRDSYIKLSSFMEEIDIIRSLFMSCVMNESGTDKYLYVESWVCLEKEFRIRRDTPGIPYI